ncbi:MAG TPA: FHA domain-containing protein [Arcobacter sp.]|nr:FHA domain-containing protein [Arcobacter sp.]
MAMVRCDANEHHYDNSKHSSCPHCTSGRGNDEKTSIRAKPHPKTEVSSEKDTFIRDNKLKLDKNSGSKTVAPWARKKTKKDESTLETKSAYSDAPVVGWLVVFEGLQKGRDFRIIPGINTIGRGNINTINIDNGDSEISRERHCLIEYDLKSGQFYLERGTTSTSHNGGRVGGNGNELALGDTIEIGSTILKFIPFCNSEFCWEM